MIETLPVISVLISTSQKSKNLHANYGYAHTYLKAKQADWEQHFYNSHTFLACDI